MGGHVLVASREQHPAPYQEELSECGVLPGIGEFDYLAAYTAAADYLSGVGLLSAPDTATFGTLIDEQFLPTMGKPGAYTERGLRFVSVGKDLTGGHLASLRQGPAPFYLRP